MMAAPYKHKKDLKAAVGEPLRYIETSMFGPEYVSTGKFPVVGPGPYDRKWYAEVTMEDDIIIKVT